MPDPSEQRGSERPPPASTSFNDLITEVARRNEEAHREAQKVRGASGRVARDQKRARDLR